MFRQYLRSSLYLKRSFCQSCYYRQQKKVAPSALTRWFHSTRPAKVPIFPIPAVLLSLVKTGKLVSFVSLSSKTSLTLLPHTFRRGRRAELIAKILTVIPLAGFSLLVIIGLDQAPNTSRLRFIYLSEEEEAERIRIEMTQLFGSQFGLIADDKHETVMWLQTIVDNLAAVAVDDVRDPVRRYRESTEQSPKPPTVQVVPATVPSSGGQVDAVLSTEEEEDGFRPPIPSRSFTVSLINDQTTVNALCAGPYIVVYNLLVELMDYDSTKMAVILSHEIAHSIQRHFVEQHGLSSLMFMLGDITRGVFWIFTESLGPYVNQVINDYISAFINLETETTYNRKLEKEADLIGLKFLAKAGYDPRVAVEVWETMDEYAQAMSEGDNDSEVIQRLKAVRAKRALPTTGESTQNSEHSVEEFIDSLVESWFGSTHPPNQERIEYMKSNMKEAMRIYEETLKINGPAIEYEFFKDPKKKDAITIHQFDILGIYHGINRWVSSFITSKQPAY